MDKLLQSLTSMVVKSKSTVSTRSLSSSSVSTSRISRIRKPSIVRFSWASSFSNSSRLSLSG